MTSIKEKLAALPPPPDQEKTDVLCTVLYGYGKVPPTSVSYLDDYPVIGGVIKHVPLSLALHWRNGTRPDGKRPYGRVKITILEDDASEADYLEATGLTPEEIHALALRFKGTNVDAIISQLGVDGARDLFNTLSKHFSGRLSQ